MKRAFTLIELLVVIAIIALLSSIVLTSLNASRAKARDAKRVSDLREVEKALELYANENNGAYPATSGAWRSECAGNPSQYVVYDGTRGNGIVPNDIAQFPVDPQMNNNGSLNVSTCCYAYISDGVDYDVLDYNCPVANVSNSALASFKDPQFPSMWSVHTAGAAAKNW